MEGTYASPGLIYFNVGVFNLETKSYLVLNRSKVELQKGTEHVAEASINIWM